MRVIPFNEPPFPFLAPSPNSLNLSAYPLDLLHRIKTVGDRNRALAYNLGIIGTPAFIAGTELVPGALDVNGLKELIARAGIPKRP